MSDLRLSTATQVIIGPFAQAANGVTPLESLTINQADIKLSKNGGAFSQKSETTAANHDTDGYYIVLLDATDTDTAGRLKIQVTVAGSVLVWSELDIVTQTYYDSKYTGTYNNLSASDVNTQCTASLNTYDGPTNAELNARTLLANDYFDPAADTVANVTNVATCAVNADMRGTDNALLASSAPANWSSMSISSAGNVNALVQGYLGTLLTESTAGRIAGNFDTFFENSNSATTKTVDDVGTGGSGGGSDWTESEKSEIRGRLGVTGNVAAGGNTPTLATQTSINDLNNFDPANDTVVNVTNCANNGDMRGTDNALPSSSYVAPDNAGITSNGTAISSLSNIFNTQMTESYSAVGQVPTPAQALLLILQNIGESSALDTTLTVKQLDGTTDAATYTLNDANNPTSRTRTT